MNNDDDILRIESLQRRVRKARAELLDYFPGDYYAMLVIDGLHQAEKYLSHMMGEAYQDNKDRVA